MCNVHGCGPWGGGASEEGRHWTNLSTASNASNMLERDSFRLELFKQNIKCLKWQRQNTQNNNTSHSHFLSSYVHPHPLHYTSSHHTLHTHNTHDITQTSLPHTILHPHNTPSPFTHHPSPSPTSELEQSPQDCHHDEWHHPLSCKTVAHIASERTASIPTLLPSCLPKLCKLVKTHWTPILVHNLQGTVHNNCLQLQPTNNVRPSAIKHLALSQVLTRIKLCKVNGCGLNIYI